MSNDEAYFTSPKDVDITKYQIPKGLICSLSDALHIMSKQLGWFVAMYFNGQKTFVMLLTFKEDNTTGSF